MAEEERDFLMRQIQNIAKGLGKFLGVQQIKEIIQFDQTEEGDLTDDEIESVILMAKLDLIAANAQLSPQHLSVSLGMSIERIEGLFAGNSYANPEELEKLRQFVDENQEYL